jgi:SpoVK/Ycf46/Vps4 family AAA+-type ATPase
MGMFKVKSITKLNKLKEGDCIEESDLSLQNEDRVIQFSYESDEKRVKSKILPGSYSLSKSMKGIETVDIQLSDVKLLESLQNTQIIQQEADKFFSRVHIYKKYGRDPKRSILMYSIPGTGKTSVINRICRELIKDSSTTVIIWDTSSIQSSDVKDFFVQEAEFDPKVKRLILVIEDIEGGSIESESSYRDCKSALLNLLDGIGRPFQGVPTLILATTNDPERSVEALIDRPGRFDKVIELLPPNEEDCLRLLEFLTNIQTEELKEVAKIAAANKFSIAHLHEIIVRSDIDDISFLESVNQLVAHKKKVKNNFVQQNKGMGLM